MAKINLAEIEARTEKATEGPWRVRVSDAENNERYVVGSGGTFIFVDGHYHDESWCEISEADAEFIAHAREDVPALIAEVKKLRKALGFYADSMRYGGRDENGLAAIEYDAGTTASIALGDMAKEVYVGNIIQCRYCEDIIRSLTPDDIVYCTCGWVGVSGGDTELVRHCDMHEFHELSFEEAD